MTDRSSFCPAMKGRESRRSRIVIGWLSLLFSLFVSVAQSPSRAEVEEREEGKDGEGAENSAEKLK